MARRDLVDMYAMPEDYNPPLDKDLSGNTQYPNLNSEEYRRKFCMTAKAQEFHENLVANSQGQVLVVTNDYRRRLWSGSLLIYPDISTAQEKGNTIAKHPCQSPISSVVFLGSDKVLFGTATGSLELWEILAAGKDGALGVYKVDSKSGHLDVLSKVALFQNQKSKIVTASYDGGLKVWELENRELVTLNTYHGAHSSAVTDISVHPEEELFVSVSRDKSALIWDHRQVRPATGLLSNHPYHLTCCNWVDNREEPEVIVVGDAKGDVFKVDKRVPEKVLSPVSVFDRPLRKIGRSESSNKWIFIGNSTDLKVTGGEFSEIQTVYSSEDWIRDFYFTKEDNSLQVLSMDGNVKKVNLLSE